MSMRRHHPLDDDGSGWSDGRRSGAARDEPPGHPAGAGHSDVPGQLVSPSTGEPPASALLAEWGVALRPDDPLIRLLGAATTTARPGELSGEENAVAAFRAARSTAAGRARTVGPAPGRPTTCVVRRIRLRWPRRRSTLLVWITAVAVTATAGVTLAAGREPGSERTDGRRAGTERAAASPSGTRTGADVPVRPGGGPGGDPSRGPTGQLDPSAPVALPVLLRQLCRSYLEQPAEQRERISAEQPFSHLVQAAGGTAQVEAYCRALVPAGPTPTGRSRPDRSPRTGAPPTVAPEQTGDSSGKKTTG
jgi:hypothetical protein